MSTLLSNFDSSVIYDTTWVTTGSNSLQTLYWKSANVYVVLHRGTPCEELRNCSMCYAAARAAYTPSSKQVVTQFGVYTVDGCLRNCRMHTELLPDACPQGKDARKKIESFLKWVLLCDKCGLVPSYGHDDAHGAEAPAE
jgi:hypothetical protein